VFVLQFPRQKSIFKFLSKNDLLREALEGDLAAQEVPCILVEKHLAEGHLIYTHTTGNP
jgi:hypothetical protein